MKSVYIYILGGRRNWWSRERVVGKTLVLKKKKKKHSARRTKRHTDVIILKEGEPLRRKYPGGCAEKRSEDIGSHCLQECHMLLKIEAGLQDAKKRNRARLLF